jgi:hypothetical protein
MGDLLHAVPRVHPEAGVQRVGGRLLAAGPDDYLHAFEEPSGEASPVAERIIELSDGTRTVGQIVEALCGEFDVSPQVCTSDTVAFVELLVKRKVLVLG